MPTSRRLRLGDTSLADTKLVHVQAATLRPSYRLKRMCEVLHGGSMASAVETAIFDAKAINAMAAILGDALEASTHPTTGAVDLKDAALSILQTLMRHQR